MMMSSDARADVAFRKLINGEDAERDIYAALYGGKLAARGGFLTEIHMLLVKLGPKHLRAMLKTISGRYSRQIVFAALEAHTGRAVWMRKDNLRRADGLAKNITIGTRVITMKQWHKGSQGSVEGYQHGVVERAAAGNSTDQRAAKAAIGTQAALLVRLDSSLTPSDYPE